MFPSRPTLRADVALVAARALVVLFLGFGLVLMHHVAAGPHDSADGSAPATIATVDHDAHAGHGTGNPDAPHGEHGSMLLHLCLAVLAAAVSVVALVLPGHLVARARDDEKPEGGLVVAPVPRPPPVPNRLARLQVLRL